MEKGSEERTKARRWKREVLLKELKSAHLVQVCESVTFAAANILKYSVNSVVDAAFGLLIFFAYVYDVSKVFGAHENVGSHRGQNIRQSRSAPLDSSSWHLSCILTRVTLGKRREERDFVHGVSDGIAQGFPKLSFQAVP